MTRDEQIKFVEELSKNILNGIAVDIEDGKIPEDWDGFELRQLLSDRSAPAFASMNKARARDYKNTVIVNNL